MTYRPSLLFRLIPIIGMLAFLAFAVLGIVTAVIEDAPIGWWSAGGALLAVGYFAFNAWQVAYSLTLHRHHLTILRLGREITLHYSNITAVILRPTILTFHLPSRIAPGGRSPTGQRAQGPGLQKISLYGDPQGLAHLYGDLRTRIPILQREKQAARERALPIIHQRNIGPDLIAGVGIAAVCLFLLGMLGWSWLSNSGEDNLLATGLIGCFSAILLPVSVGMVATAIRRVTFTQDTITVQSVWRTKTYPVQALSNIEVKAEDRTHRGITRTYYTLALAFDNQKTIEIPPTFSDASGVRQEAARLELLDLRAALLKHYPMVTIERPSNAYAPKNEWGDGWIIRIFHIKPYNITIQEEDYGEIHRSANSLHYVFSRPIVEGLTRFRTVDGNLIYTPDGRFLVLYEMAHLIVFDLQENNAHHTRFQGYLQQAVLDGNILRMKLLPLGQPASNIVDLPPVPLEQLSQFFTAGTGSDAASQTPPSRNPQATTPVHSVVSLLAQARALGDKLPEQFETFRDALGELGPDAFPRLHAEARTTKDAALLELLVTVLVDSAYPPAFPDFLTWLDHPNDEIRYFCASALDQIAGKRFGIDKMIERGWVQHDKILSAIPAIKAWWADEGMHRVPTLASWHKEASAPPVPDLHKWFNFVELNPWWVRFGQGEVAQKPRGFQLPRNQGTHIVGGQVWFSGRLEPVFGAFEMDSGMGWVKSVYVKEAGKWEEVSERMARAEPNFRF